MPDANKEQSLNSLIGATFGAAGQRCMATSVTVLVGEAQRWIPDIVAKAKTLKVNAGVEKNADLGPVVSKNARQRILGLVEDGIKEGAKLELDGRGIKVPGYEHGNFIGPTIFSAVTPQMKIHTTEIFGPVMVIVSVNTWMRRSPSSATILSATAPVFTQSGAVARKFQSEIDVSQCGCQRAHPVPVPFSALPDHAVQAGRSRSLRQAGGAVLHADQTVTSRWFDDGNIRQREHHHQLK